MALAVEDSLVQVGHRPPLGHIELQQPPSASAAAGPVMVLRQVRKGTSSFPFRSKAR